MKIRASLLAASAAAVIAYGITYTDRGPGAPVATFVLGAFLVVLIGGLVLSAAASRADREREDEQARRLQQIRADGDRAIEADRERWRRSCEREQRVRRVELALWAVKHSCSSWGRDPEPEPVQRRLEAVLAAAKRNASRSEIAEAERRCRPVRF
jgi:uncharacterized membrane protein YraQ (UPF0718 family)